MKHTRIIVLLVAAIYFSQISAQIFTQVINEEELQLKVKLIDEFFQRFNFETDYYGNPVNELPDSVRNNPTTRRNTLVSLLNLSKFQTENENLDSISSEFVDYVIQHDCHINYADTTWYAEAESSLLIGAKKHPLTLFLRTENVRDVIYKWVIFDVESSIFTSLTYSIDSTKTILPGAHGSSFMTVPKSINLNAKTVKSFFNKNYKPCPLTVFDYLISNGSAKVQNVTKVKYHFKVDDYEFTVERFEKEKTYNKGWLISNIVKNN